MNGHLYDCSSMNGGAAAVVDWYCNSGNYTLVLVEIAETFVLDDVQEVAFAVVEIDAIGSFVQSTVVGIDCLEGLTSHYACVHYSAYLGSDANFDNCPAEKKVDIVGDAADWIGIVHVHFDSVGA